MRVPAAVAGLLGGLCWVGAYVADAAEAGAGLIDGLTWAGLVLLVGATLAAGASLVSRSAVWLRVIVAVGFVLLAGSVLEVMRDGGDPVIVDAVFGAGAAVVAAVVLARGRRTEPAPPPARHNRGSHAR